MNISGSAWQKYLDGLRQLNEGAYENVKRKLENYDLDNLGRGARQAIIDWMYDLVGTYGEASSELACQMYDATAEASGVILPPAEPAPIPDYGEVAMTVNGTLKTGNPDDVAKGASRLVKRTGVDTTMKNAIRDGAEWAWVPHGDTCAFCITLASRGWQNASKKALKNGHAEHIHAHCDCTYAVRFDGKSSVEGYDPQVYEDMYYGAEGDTPQEKINSLRKIHYAEHKDEINAQKREAYKKRKSAIQVEEHERLYTKYPNIVQRSALDAPGFIEKFEGITGIETVDNAIYRSSIEILKHRDGTDFEDLYLIDAKTGDIIHKLTTCNEFNGVSYDKETKAAIRKAHQEQRSIIALHNHPGGLPPSLDDGVSVVDHGYVKGVAVGHNLEVYCYSGADRVYSKEECDIVAKEMVEKLRFDIVFDDKQWYDDLENFKMKVERR